MSKTIIIPNLDLHDVKDVELSEFAAYRVKCINLVPAFAAVVPSTATVEAKRVQYWKALIATDNGKPADTSFKNDRRAELEDLLTKQAWSCAVIANGDLALYLRSGYAAKNTKGTPTGELHQVKGVVIDYGDGELKARWKPMAKAKNFSVQVYADEKNPEGSIIREYVKPKLGRKRTVLDRLPSGQIVFVRVRANGGKTGHGPWSASYRKRVP